MNDVDSSVQKTARTGFKSAETWAIVAVLFAAGAVFGYPIGAGIERTGAGDRVQEIVEAYAKTIDAKEQSVQLCLGQAGKAANTANNAASTAAKAADTAAGAASTAKEAVERAAELPK